MSKRLEFIDRCLIQLWYVILLREPSPRDTAAETPLQPDLLALQADRPQGLLHGRSICFTDNGRVPLWTRGRGFRCHWQLETGLCYTTLYHTIPYHRLSTPYSLYHTIPYHTTGKHTILYHTIPYHTIPYYALYIYMYISLFLSLSLYIYIYIYIHTYVYIYIYIYIYV